MGDSCDAGESSGATVLGTRHQDIHWLRRSVIYIQEEWPGLAHILI
jgi:hypothetical protein